VKKKVTRAGGSKQGKKKSKILAGKGKKKKRKRGRITANPPQKILLRGNGPQGKLRWKKKRGDRP